MGHGNCVSARPRRQADNELCLRLDQDAVWVGLLGEGQDAETVQQAELGGTDLSLRGSESRMPDGVGAEATVTAMIEAGQRMCEHDFAGLGIGEAGIGWGGVRVVSQLDGGGRPFALCGHAVGGVATGGILDAVHREASVVPG